MLSFNLFPLSVFIFFFICTPIGINTNAEVHGSDPDFSQFPRWFKNTEEKGFYVTGYEGNNSYGIFSYLEKVRSEQCDLISHTNFSWSLQCAPQVDEVLLYYYNNGERFKTELALSELPHPSCTDPSETFMSIRLESHAPGERIVYCKNFSMFESWNEFENASNCYNVYMVPTLTSCNVVHSSRSLQSSCSIEVIPKEDAKDNEIHINLGSVGTVQLSSNRFIKSESCAHECTLIIGDINELVVTCPDGSQHHFELESDLRKRCYGIDVPYFRWIAMLFCKISYHPIIIFFLLIWLVASKLIIQITYYLTASIIDFFVIKMRKKTQEKLKEQRMAFCITCRTNVYNKAEAERHVSCKRNCCPVCSKCTEPQDFQSHVKNCMLKKDTILDIGQNIQEIKDNVRVSKWLLKASLHKTSCSIIRWIVIFGLLLGIYLPPVSSMNTTVSDASEDPEFSNYQTYIKGIFPEELNVFTSPHLDKDYLTEIRKELEFCGRDCLTEEGVCTCPNEGVLNATTHSESAQRHKPLNAKSRQKRGSSTWQKKKLGSKQRHHYNKEKQEYGHEKTNLQKAYKLEPVYQYIRKPKHFFTIHSKKTDKPDAQISFHQAQNILTNWGPIHIDNSYTPSQDNSNINLSWETYKKDKENVYVKGSSIAKLNVYPGSGITYIISNLDSTEKRTISTYIYDFSQVYKTTLKYITVDRRVKTWFRGACTGNCPEHCACETKTCHYKKWDYDRNLGCNPSWCWATNSGCSCCAMDVTIGESNWIAAIYETEYIKTELVICNNLGFDKLNCKVISDNEQSNYGEVKFTHSATYSINKLLPTKIAVLWHKHTDGSFKPSMPEHLLLDPPFCDYNCNHGVPGDYKFYTLNDFFNPTKAVHAEMSWIGVDVEHTCHFASWPDCDFYNLKKDITNEFSHLNITSKHASTDFFIQKALITPNNQLDIQVRPKSNAGTIDVTIQLKNFALKKKELPLKISEFKIHGCQGCYACSSGAECSFTLRLITPRTFSIHLTTTQPGVILREQTFIVNSSKPEQLYSIQLSTILNISEVTFCLVELPHLCSSKQVILDEPLSTLIESAHTSIHTPNEETGKCSGFTAIITCTGGNIVKGIVSVFSDVGGIFTNIFNTIEWVVKILIFGLFLFVFLKLSTLAYGVLKPMFGLLSLKRIKKDELKKSA